MAILAMVTEGSQGRLKSLVINYHGGEAYDLLDDETIDLLQEHTYYSGDLKEILEIGGVW